MMPRANTCVTSSSRLSSAQRTMASSCRPSALMNRLQGGFRIHMRTRNAPFSRSITAHVAQADQGSLPKEDAAVLPASSKLKAFVDVAVLLLYVVCYKYSAAARAMLWKLQTNVTFANVMFILTTSYWVYQFFSDYVFSRWKTAQSDRVLLNSLPSRLTNLEDQVADLKGAVDSLTTSVASTAAAIAATSAAIQRDLATLSKTTKTDLELVKRKIDMIHFAVD